MVTIPERFAEPWRRTILRTGVIAVAIGVGVGVHARRLAPVPLAALLALWFTLGGHYIEILLRNEVGHRIGGSAPVRAVVRVAGWFLGGSALYAGALATRALLTEQRAVPWPWWTGGAAFVGLELLVHLMLRARGQPSFYDGRG